MREPVPRKVETLMLGSVVASLAMFQDDAASDGHLLTVFVGIAAFSLLLQVLMLVGVGVGALVTIKKVTAEINELKGLVMPTVAKAQGLITQVSDVTQELTPTIRSITTKVDTITGHAEDISGMVKSKVEEFGPTITKANETILSANATVMDATAKTHEQLLRVNQMISETLTATERAGKKAVHNITQPGREIAGIASGVKVAVQSFLSQQGAGEKRGPVSAFQEEDEYRVRRPGTVADALRRDKSNDIGL